jgi:hypothetical protein
MLITPPVNIAAHVPVKTGVYPITSPTDICIGLTTKALVAGTVTRNALIRTGILYYFTGFDPGDNIYTGTGTLTNVSIGQMVGTMLTSNTLLVNIINNNFKPIEYSAFTGDGTQIHTINAKATLSSIMINISGLAVLPGTYTAEHVDETTRITLSGTRKFNINQPCVVYYQRL